MASALATASPAGLRGFAPKTMITAGSKSGMASNMCGSLGRPQLLTYHLASSFATARTGMFALPERKFCKERKSGKSLIRAVASPMRTSVPGFYQLSESIPEDLSLLDIVKTLPEEVFKVDNFKAWRNVVFTVTAVAVGYAALAVAPWYLYPLVYAYLGTAVTGLFVIGHDCGHLSFSENKLVNDVVGTIMLAPLIYPFEPWRIKHNTHHAHTNKLIVDTAWQPIRPHVYDRSQPWMKRVLEGTMGPFWWAGSVFHWIIWHFDLSKFKPQERTRVKISWAAVGAFVVGVLVPLMVTQGPLGFVKWWLLPWMGYHFWMSTFTLVHHTAPHIPFKSSRDWNAAEAQLAGTVHCDYPNWVELLCHDISVHIPHHISSRIPSYNLRKAYASIQENFDKHLNKAVFGPALMSTIIRNCQLYDARNLRYVRFDNSQLLSTIDETDDLEEAASVI